MKRQIIRSAAILTLAAVLMTGSASALFGIKKTEDPVPGAPQVWDLEVQTYRDIPVQGQFLAADQEGDEMTLALENEPKKGVVVIEGLDFIYTPDEGVTGSDSFTYTATDSEGHVSLPAKVTVKIDKTRSGVTYADMEGSSAAYAAQRLAEDGIFTGAQIGGQYYFQPEQTVSREEFLALTLEAVDREVTAVTMTGFCDDASIPAWAKAYAAAAVADGVIMGRATDQGPAFRGEDLISFNEAAAILDRVLDLGDVDLEVWYADRETADSWAAQSVGNMEAVSVLPAGSFGSQTLAQPLTRADAALMLASVRTLLQDTEKSR